MSVLVPDGDGELAVQMFEHGDTMFFVEVDDDLGGALGVKMMPFADQFVPQFGIVEYFAVEYDPDGAVLVVNGLMTAAQVDDAQAGVRQAGLIAGIDAGGIGSAVASGPRWRMACSMGLSRGMKSSFCLKLMIPAMPHMRDPLVCSLLFVVCSSKNLATDADRHPQTSGLCCPIMGNCQRAIERIGIYRTRRSQRAPDLMLFSVISVSYPVGLHDLKLSWRRWI